jgi:hypothetical protein
VQVAVTIYENQSGGELTTAGEAFPVTAGPAQVITATVTEQTAYQFAPAEATEQQPHFILAYVAIAAILATVMIVTVGLVVYSRRPSGYFQVPRGY